jgi:hypothetical protein
MREAHEALSRGRDGQFRRRCLRNVSVGDARGPQLLLFDDPAPEGPIHGRHGRIDRACGGAPGLVDDVHDVSQEAIIVGCRKSACGIHPLPRPLLPGTLINTRKQQVYNIITSTRRILFYLMHLIQLVIHALSEAIACVSSAVYTHVDSRAESHAVVHV